MKTRILFLIRSLGVGGNERQLIELIKNLDPSRWEVEVVTFYAGGALFPEMQSIPGVTTRTLAKQSRWDLAALYWRFPKIVRTFKPALLCTVAEGPNELGSMLRPFLGVKLVWLIGGNGRRGLRYFDWFSRAVFKMGAMFSRRTGAIIINSNSGKKNYAAQGYAGEKMVVVPNGFDLQRFQPDAQKRKEQRQAWGVSEEETLVGIVGRIHPIKDHKGFLKAAAAVGKDFPKARFVVVGNGDKEFVEELKRVGETVLWPGVCTNMSAAYNALDILVNNSTDEGLPNVVGEAMACGVPCIVTDVGDSAVVVGETGIVIQPSDPVALAEAMRTLMKEERGARSKKARERIVSSFSVELLARNSEKVFEQVLKK